MPPAAALEARNCVRAPAVSLAGPSLPCGGASRAPQTLCRARIAAACDRGPALV